MAIALTTLLFAVLAYLLWTNGENPPPTKAETTESSTEAADWAAAQRSNTIPAYAKFLENHRNSPHGAEAEKARKGLEQKFFDTLSDAVLDLGPDGLGPESALKKIDTMLRLWPEHPAVSDARMQIGEGLVQEALKILEQARRKD